MSLASRIRALEARLPKDLIPAAFRTYHRWHKRQLVHEIRQRIVKFNPTPNLVKEIEKFSPMPEPSKPEGYDRWHRERQEKNPLVLEPIENLISAIRGLDTAAQEMPAEAPEPVQDADGIAIMSPSAALLAEPEKPAREAKTPKVEKDRLQGFRPDDFYKQAAEQAADDAGYFEPKR